MELLGVEQSEKELVALLRAAPIIPTTMFSSLCTNWCTLPYTAHIMRTLHTLRTLHTAPRCLGALALTIVLELGKHFSAREGVLAGYETFLLAARLCLKQACATPHCF